MNAINLKLENIYQGKATMIKDNKYLSTQQYVEPFVDKIDKMCQGNFAIKAQPANQISLTLKGDVNMEDIVFNKVWIQGLIPGEFPLENYQQSINMVYALDTRKPLVKIFKSPINVEKSIMCVFSPEHLNIQEIIPDTLVDYSIVDEIIKLEDSTKVNLDSLKKISFDQEDLKEKLGYWIDNCINTKYISNFGTIKLSETLPIEVYKTLLFDEKSPYYMKNGATNGFNIYNAFSNILTNDDGKDIVNKFEKIFMVNNLLKNDK